MEQPSTSHGTGFQLRWNKAKHIKVESKYYFKGSQETTNPLPRDDNKDE